MKSVIHKLLSIFILLALGLTPFFSSATSWANAYGQINSIELWVNGSDTYGVWVTLKAGSSTPSDCGLNYFLPHSGTNKELVYSSLLTAKVSNGYVTIQTDQSKNASGLCRIHKVKI